MGSDLIDFMEYLKRHIGASKPTISLEDIEAFCRLDDASVSWISSLFAFARYTLFLKTLFYINDSGTGNRNAGFMIGFTEDHLEHMTKSICSALSAMDRSFRVADAAGKSYLKIVYELTGLNCSSNYAAYEAMRALLYESDDVILVKGFSLSKSPSKAGKLRDWIKTLDDAHLHGVTPNADLILVDYGSFLQKVWNSIGPYLSILAYSDDEADIMS